MKRLLKTTGLALISLAFCPTLLASGNHKMHHDMPHGKKTEPATRPLYLTAQMQSHHKEMMKSHLVVIQQVTQHLASSSFELALKAATPLGYSKSEAKHCSNMGAATPGFFDLGIGMHKAADQMIAAIEKKDLAKSLHGLAGTLRTCTTCHQTFHHQVVSQDEFNRLAKLGIKHQH